MEIQKISIPNSTNFSPKTIGGLLAWIDSNDLSTIFQNSSGTVSVMLDGDSIGSIFDKSGNLNNLTQITSGQRPVYKTGIIGNKSTIRFTGSSKHHLTFGNRLGRPASYTIFAVLSAASISTNQFAFGSIDSSGASRKAWGICNLYRGNITGSVGYFFGDDVNFSDGRCEINTLQPNTSYIISKTYIQGGNCEFVYINGRQCVSGGETSVLATANSGTSYDFSIGRPGAFDGLYLTGDISEFLVYSQVLTDDKRRLVEKYLGNKYKIQIQKTTRYQSSNANTSLTTPTYDGSGQATHPSIIDTIGGWNGYRFWMGMTPYPNDTSALENPSILASNDGNTWSVPSGTTNPIVSAPGSPTFNADSEIILGQDNKLYLFYMVSDSSTYNKGYILNSTDGGRTWTSPTLIITEAYKGFGSPAVVWDGSQYTMWYVDGSALPFKVYKRTCNTPDGNWSAKILTSMISPTNRQLWHLSVYYKNGIYFAFVTLSTSLGTNTTLVLGTSLDGVNWKLDARNLLEPSSGGLWDSGQIYRSSGIQNIENEFDLWYSARNKNQSPTIWHIGRTRVITT